MEYLKFIPSIVKGFEIPENSKVLLHFWGENSNLDILDRFAVEILKNKSIPVKWQESREFYRDYFSEAVDEKADYPEIYSDIFSKMDAVVDIFMYGPSPHREFPQNKMSLYRQYIRNMFNALSSNKKIFIQVQVPTIENAADNNMDFEVYKNSMYEALSMDIDKLKKRTTILLAELKKVNKIEIYTGDDVLEFNLGERKWHKDDGKGDVPCGEVYIAPVEESANGTIHIKDIYLDGVNIHNVKMEFESGKLVNCTAPEIMELISHFKGDSDKIAEFGLGLNEKVKRLTGCSLIDEKCYGTAHIAIGMNNLFGGKNQAGIHIDFVFKPSRIYGDGKLIMEEDQLMI